MGIKTIKVLRTVSKIVLLVIILGLLGWGGYYVYRSIAFKPQNIVVTNITDSSATITWTTSSQMNGVVYYKKDTSVLPGPLGIIGSQVAYDDRDVSDAQTACVNEFNKNAGETKDENFSVSGENFDCENARVTGMGKYYTHSVTIKDLDPESTYYFSMGDGIWSFKSDVSSVKTFALLEEVKEPMPIFGRVLGDDGGYSRDGLVYITFSDGSEDTDSIIYSSTTSDDGGWYVDASSIKDSSGNILPLELGNDTFRIKAKYINYGESAEEKHVFGYFEVATFDIVVTKNTSNVQSLLNKFILSAYAENGVAPENCSTCPTWMSKEQVDAIRAGTANCGEIGYGNCLKVFAGDDKKLSETEAKDIQENGDSTLNEELDYIAGAQNMSDYCNSKKEFCKVGGGCSLEDGKCGYNEAHVTSCTWSNSGDCSGLKTCESGKWQLIVGSCNYIGEKKSACEATQADACSGRKICFEGYWQSIPGECGLKEVVKQVDKGDICTVNEYNHGCYPGDGTSKQCLQNGWSYSWTYYQNGNCRTRTNDNLSTAYIEACDEGPQEQKCKEYCKKNPQECTDANSKWSREENPKLEGKHTTLQMQCNEVASECGFVSDSGVVSLLSSNPVWDSIFPIAELYGAESHIISTVGYNLLDFVSATRENINEIKDGNIGLNQAIENQLNYFNKIEDYTRYDAWCVLGGGKVVIKEDGTHDCPNVEPLSENLFGVSGAYAADETSYAYYLPDYGMYSFQLGDYTLSTEVSDGKTIYLFYIETNGIDGIQIPADPTNPTSEEDIVLGSSAYEITYEQESTAQQYDIAEGINIVSFDFVPTSTESGAYMASDVIAQATTNEVNIEYMSIFDGGRWYEAYSCSSDTCTGTDFSIVPGRGYLVKASNSGTITIPGYNLTSSVPIAFSSGWNLVGIHGYTTAYTARTLIDSINTVEGLTANNVSWWPTSKGKYEGLQVENGTEYGLDFAISPTNGYFVRISEYAPSDTTCKSILWNEGGTLNGTCGNTK